MTDHFDEATLLAAHKTSLGNEALLAQSEEAGCFYCLWIGPAPDIVRWVREADGARTALCPRCGIDSVIGDAAGQSMTPNFLQAMQARWFEAGGWQGN